MKNKNQHHDMKNPVLLNAVEEFRQDRDLRRLYRLPTRKEIANLGRGDVVEVWSPSSEFFHLEIESRDGDIFVGRVKCHGDAPEVSGKLRWGSVHLEAGRMRSNLHTKNKRVHFHSENIFCIGHKIAM